MTDRDRTSAGGFEQRVRRLEFTVDWPPGHATAYLVPGEEPVLVDAGMPGTDASTELSSGLSEHRYSPGDVDHVLLTHAHRDHVGQVRTLLENGSPTVYAPRVVRDRYQRDIETIETATRSNLLEAGVDRDLLDSSTERVVGFHRTVRELLPLDAVDVWIDHGESVSVGPMQIDPIHAPGHHVSQFCYGTTIGGERTVFSGDVAMKPFRAPALLVNFDEGVRDGVTTFFETLRRLESYDFDRVFPGHGPIHTAYDAVIDRSISDLESTLEASLDALSADGTTAFSLARDRTGRKRGIERMLSETVALLSSLEADGRARSTLEDGVRYYEPA